MTKDNEILRNIVIDKPNDELFCFRLFFIVLVNTSALVSLWAIRRNHREYIP